MMRTKIVLLLTVVLIAVGCKKKSSDDYNYYKPYKDSINSVDTISDSKAMVESKAEVKEVEKKKEVKGADLNDNYFLVVASYTVDEFAYERKAELEKQGYKPVVFMLDDDGWFKLAVESYKTLDEAKTALPKLQKKSDIFAEARIVFKRSK